MPMNEFSQETVNKALRGLGHYRVTAAQHIASEGPPDEFSGALLLTLGLRESLLQNVISPSGTDRGCFQINDYWHKEFLQSQPGCLSGLWQATKGKTAYNKGFVPRFTPSCVYAVDILKNNADIARDHGVEKELIAHFALAAYNAGATDALDGYRGGAIDKHTANGDYGAWVLAHRRKVLIFLKEHPNWRI